VPNSPSHEVAARLLDIAYDLTASSGPNAVSLREVQRQAGVSAATAYWHFKNRADLMLSVSRRATADLANALGAAADQAPSPEDAVKGVCLAYLHFARDHQGLFQVIVANSSTEELERPHESARGRSGYAAFEILQRSLAALAAERQPFPEDTALHVWAACHGLAAVLIDTPIALTPEEDKERLRQQHVSFIVRALPPAL
jgi:AcrR family transcriptional regulator